MNQELANRLVAHAYSYAVLHFDPDKNTNVFAVILDKQKNLISACANSYVKTHPFQKEMAILANQHERIYLHAEIGCIIKAKGEGHYLTIIRLAKDGVTMLPSIPCPVCRLALEKSNIKYFIYTSPTTGSTWRLTHDRQGID